jgi:fluoride ion exporter CrcB/FEX
VLWVGFGGFLGAVLRYSLSLVAARLGGGWPLGTLLVNALGCLAGGLLLFAIEQEAVSPRARAFLGVGTLGTAATFGRGSSMTSASDELDMDHSSCSSTFQYDASVRLRNGNHAR